VVAIFAAVHYSQAVCLSESPISAETHERLLERPATLSVLPSGEKAAQIDVFVTNDL
jgi:hypothetical protein